MTCKSSLFLSIVQEDVSQKMWLEDGPRLPLKSMGKVRIYIYCLLYMFVEFLNFFQTVLHQTVFLRGRPQVLEHRYEELTLGIYSVAAGFELWILASLLGWIPIMEIPLCMYVCLSVCLSVRPAVRPSSRPSVRPSVCPSVCVSVRLSVCMFLCM